MQGHRLNHEERIRRIASDAAEATHRICDLLDTGPNQQVDKRTSAEKHQQCMQVLQRLRDVYALAASATSSLQEAIRSPNLPTNSSPQTSKLRAKKTKHTSATVVTPPPDTDDSAAFSHSSMPSEYLRSIGEDSPPASDGSYEYTSSNGLLPLDHRRDSTIGDFDLDQEFDTLFNLDADMQILDAEEDKGKGSWLANDVNGLHRGIGWTPPTPWSASGIQASPQQVSHCDQIVEMGASAHA